MPSTSRWFYHHLMGKTESHFSATEPNKPKKASQANNSLLPSITIELVFNFPAGLCNLQRHSYRFTPTFTISLSLPCLSCGTMHPLQPSKESKIQYVFNCWINRWTNEQNFIDIKCMFSIMKVSRIYNRNKILNAIFRSQRSLPQDLYF